MSLFPAYSSNLGDDIHPGATPLDTDSDTTKCEPSKDNWLENPSFTLEISEIPLPTVSASRLENDLSPEAAAVENQTSTYVPEFEINDKVSPSPVERSAKKRSIDDYDDVKRSRRKKSKRSKSHKQAHSSKSSRSTSDPKVSSLPEENSYFYTDKKSERGNLNVVKLHRPATPMYKTPYYFVLGLVPYSYEYADRKRKKKSKRINRRQRYFNNLAQYNEQEENEPNESVGEATHETTMEGNITKQTAVFNKTLGEEKHNVAMWLAYAAFQDTVCEFEHTYRRGGVGGGGRRATTQRQLAIVDKALSHNADSEPLLRERCRLIAECFPGDEAATQFRALLDKRPRSMALWQGYIGATQFSLSSCSVAKVMALYQEAMDRFHQMRRVAASETRRCEERILDLLLRSALFLRQAGLHEQMWTLLKHYLELTLAMEVITVAKGFTERQVIELEEPMLLSNLPLPEIWVRVETVRESMHWLPWDEDGDCEDPQRVVFAEDVADMIHPITSHQLSFRLIAVVMAAFKVPALPCRDTALRWSGLSEIPWALDSPETLLTALFPWSSAECGVVSLLSEAAELATGPTFLAAKAKTTVLGEQMYHSFVTKVIHLCADKLSDTHRTALLVWWLRFERFLVVLAEKNVCRAIASKKKVRGTVKQFLKVERNRVNLLFYREYALLERDCGNLESAVDCLRLTLSTHDRGEPVSGMACPETRAHRAAVFRALAELLITADRVDEARNVLASMATGRPIAVDRSCGDDHAAAADMFRHVASELLSDVDLSESSDGMEHLLPDFTVDWIACGAWIVLLVHSVWEAGAFVEESLAKLPAPVPDTDSDCVLTKALCRREALFESYVALMHWHCRRAPGAYSVLQEVLLRALTEFPCNTALIAIAARTENAELRPWWGLKRLLEAGGSTLARVFLVFLARQRQQQAQTQSQAALGWADTSRESAALTAAGFRNRSRTLFRQLTTHPATRQSPLVWRLYLYYLFEHGGVETCRAVFYQAVEHLPWVKALYLDGAKMLPADIGHVQDLVIEKELRLHVTPEELEILRSTTA